MQRRAFRCGLVVEGLVVSVAVVVEPPVVEPSCASAPRPAMAGMNGLCVPPLFRSGRCLAARAHEAACCLRLSRSKRTQSSYQLVLRGPGPGVLNTRAHEEIAQRSWRGCGKNRWARPSHRGRVDSQGPQRFVPLLRQPRSAIRRRHEDQTRRELAIPPVWRDV